MIKVVKALRDPLFWHYFHTVFPLEVMFLFFYSSILQDDPTEVRCQLIEINRSDVRGFAILTRAKKDLYFVSTRIETFLKNLYVSREYDFQLRHSSSLKFWISKLPEKSKVNLPLTDCLARINSTRTSSPL